MSNLNDDYQFFLDNKGKLLKDYEGKYLIISNKEVKDASINEEKAYTEAIKKYGIGNFIIQYCSANAGELVQTYQSRVLI